MKKSKLLANEKMDLGGQGTSDFLCKFLVAVLF